MTQFAPHKYRCIPLIGYRHMYRSLLRFYPISKPEALALLYPMYIGNLDTCQYENIPLTMMELTSDGFYSLAEPFARPYHTEIQLYRSMNGLLSNIKHEATVQKTRTTVKQYRNMIDALEDRFENTYDCTITDPQTTYGLCWNRLIVRDSEPLTVFRPVISDKSGL
ncbi:MAG: hypothetical protein RSD95_00765 [Clostridia bacterium]